MHVFEGKSANQVWLMAVDTLLMKGEPRASRAGPTRELLHAAFEIREPRRGWVSVRTPAMNPAFALAEVIWILNGQEDSAFLNAWNRNLPKYAGFAPTYHGAYGKRLRNWLGLDQLDRATQVLAADPTSRQVVLQIWNPVRDLPSDDGLPVDPDVPCNVAACLKVRDNRLDWLQVIRSNDVFLGVPHNFVQFTILQEVMSGWIGVRPGTYIQVSDSLHAYEADLPHLAASLDASGPEQADDEASQRFELIGREECARILPELDYLARRMTHAALRPSELLSSIDRFDGPQKFRDWLLILGAESARRKGWIDISSDLPLGCEDALLRQIWTRWLNRVAGAQSQKEKGGRISTATGVAR